MNLAVMASAKRDRELIADFSTERLGLCESQVVGIRRTTAAHQTRLFGN